MGREYTTRLWYAAGKSFASPSFSPVHYYIGSLLRSTPTKKGKKKWGWGVGDRYGKKEEKSVKGEKTNLEMRLLLLGCHRIDVSHFQFCFLGSGEGKRKKKKERKKKSSDASSFFIKMPQIDVSHFRFHLLRGKRGRWVGGGMAEGLLKRKYSTFLYEGIHWVLHPSTFTPVVCTLLRLLMILSHPWRTFVCFLLCFCFVIWLNILGSISVFLFAAISADHYFIKVPWGCPYVPITHLHNFIGISFSCCFLFVFSHALDLWYYTQVHIRFMSFHWTMLSTWPTFLHWPVTYKWTSI